ncbi:YesK-like family protein [Psychrobacillus psychrodurans]|uniref:YesK-like family protein n=1 Tax=Psychrobacillus TaxID=1221880 RepID=UPI001F4E6913|nr:YesK-like family protein [Psychrobacillus psychrodurans]MCK1998640.1 YesK-like family protein [Psychrobacillus psychrodurans]
MDGLMLEGWTPILLCGIVFAFGMFITSRKVSRKSLFSISTVLSLICIGVIIYSVIGVGGWEGMGLGLFAITILVGTWVGTVIGAISSNSNL